MQKYFAALILLRIIKKVVKNDLDEIKKLQNASLILKNCKRVICSI